MTSCSTAGVGKFHCSFLTQKERDNESGLDYFLARYYSSAQGRFTGADEPFADQHEDDPQSWNLYAYVGNNPLKYIDPFGFWKEVSPGVWQWEEGDTWKSLAKILHVNKGDLKKSFQNAELGAGLTLDTNNFSAGTPEQTYGSNPPTALARGVLSELDRSSGASMKMIGGFAVGTAVVGATGGVALYATGAMAGSGLTTLGLSQAGVEGTAAAEVVVSEATRQAFQRQLAQHGRAALEKSLRSFERRLAEHLANLEKYRKAGGYVSSVEREIRIFRESIKAIKDILGK